MTDAPFGFGACVDVWGKIFGGEERWITDKEVKERDESYVAIVNYPSECTVPKSIGWVLDA